MKKILLLGGFGFIGTNILKYFESTRKYEYEFIVFDKFKTHQHNIKFEHLNKVYCGDFSNIQDVEIMFKENKIDLVIHSLSATIPALSSDIYFDINSNLIPSIQILDLMVKYKVGKIVYISSGGAIYGNNDINKKHHEKDDAYPISSYGVIKLTIEKYLYQYSYLYNIKSLILRLSNPYGNYHFNAKQGIINVAARCAVFSKPFHVWGNGNGKKDYILIDDFCDILFKLLHMDYSFLLLNVGSGLSLSINTILENITKIIPSFSWDYDNNSKTDVQQFELDITRLLSLIGEYRFTPFSDSLIKTIDWTREYK